jgi:release factor glutamine methyltransferase
MLAILEILKKTTEFFTAKGVENPRLNAELLVGHALGLKRMQLYLQFERLLTEPELEKIRPLVRRRAQREPLQYVLGEVEWFGLKLKVDRRALIPRPETERLAELVTQLVVTPPARILDLGTGSGALALGLAKHWPEAQVMAVDRSTEALGLACENAALLSLESRVSFLESNWFSSLPTDASFELIVANPPYLSEAETAAAEPEVRGHEPHSALISAEEGTADLKAILKDAPRFLIAGGLLALETGIAKHAELLALCAEIGFSRSESKQDLTGQDRYIFAWR